MAGLGGLELTKDPTARLIAEVNRFGPDAPEGLRYVAAPFPLATGNVPLAVAITASQINFRRTQDAVVRFGDKGSIDAHKQAATIAENPSVQVPAHIAELTEMIGAFANANGLAPSRISIAGKIADLSKSPLAVVAVVGGLAFYYFVRKGRR